MSVNFLILLGLTAIGSIAGLIGGVIFLIKKDWSHSFSHLAVPFASGVLLSVSITHLLPEASEAIGRRAFLITLGAFLGSFLFEHFFANLHHHEHEGGMKLKASVPLVIMGDTVHNFIDGIAIASAFMTSPSFGLVVAFATFLHETPHEIGDFGVLLKARVSTTKTFWLNFFSSLATFPGAILTYFVLSGGHEKVAPLLAVSAGIFLYLGASDFLPSIEDCEKRKSSWKEVVLVVLGVLVIYLLSFVSVE